MPSDWEIFCKHCSNGNLEEAKALHDANDFCVNEDDERPFVMSCRGGHIDVAKWLLSLNQNIDIHVGWERAFRFSCRYGHLHVAKWLWSLDKKIDIHAFDDEAFLIACSNGYLNVAKWLWSLDHKINIYARDYRAFSLSLQNEFINVYQWLCGIEDEWLYYNLECLEYKPKKNRKQYAKPQKFFVIDTKSKIIL